MVSRKPLTQKALRTTRSQKSLKTPLKKQIMKEVKPTIKVVPPPRRVALRPRHSTRCEDVTQKKNFAHFAEKVGLPNEESQLQFFDHAHLLQVTQMTGFARKRLSKMTAYLEAKQQMGERKQTPLRRNKKETTPPGKESSPMKKETPEKENEMTPMDESQTEVKDQTSSAVEEVDEVVEVIVPHAEEKQVPVTNEEEEQEEEAYHPGMLLRQLLRSNRLEEAIALHTEKQEQERLALEEWLQRVTALSPQPHVAEVESKSKPEPAPVSSDASEEVAVNHVSSGSSNSSEEVAVNHVSSGSSNSSEDMTFNHVSPCSSQSSMDQWCAELSPKFPDLEISFVEEEIKPTEPRDYVPISQEDLILYFKQHRSSQVKKFKKRPEPELIILD